MYNFVVEQPGRDNDKSTGNINDKRAHSVEQQAELQKKADILKAEFDVKHKAFKRRSCQQPSDSSSYRSNNVVVF